MGRLLETTSITVQHLEVSIMKTNKFYSTLTLLCALMSAAPVLAVNNESEAKEKTNSLYIANNSDLTLTAKFSVANTTTGKTVYIESKTLVAGDASIFDAHSSSYSNYVQVAQVDMPNYQYKDLSQPIVEIFHNDNKIGEFSGISYIPPGSVLPNLYTFYCLYTPSAPLAGNQQLLLKGNIGEEIQFSANWQSRNLTENKTIWAYRWDGGKPTQFYSYYYHQCSNMSIENWPEA